MTTDPIADALAELERTRAEYEAGGMLNPFDHPNPGAASAYLVALMAHTPGLVSEIRRLRADRADLEGKAAALAAGVYAEWGLDTMRCVAVLVQDECWRRGREVERLTAELAAARLAAAARPRCWKCGAGPTEPSGG